MPAKKSNKKTKANTSKKNNVKKKKPVQKATKTKKPVAKKNQARTKSVAKKPKAAQKSKTKKSVKKVVKVEKPLPRPKPLRLNYMNLLQFLLEFIVAAGFFFGLFGYNYDILGYYCVLPLTFVNFIISFVENNRTITYSAINMVMALIAFYPIIGFFAKLVGIALSISSITVLSARLHE